MVMNDPIVEYIDMLAAGVAMGLVPLAKFKRPALTCEPITQRERKDRDKSGRSKPKRRRVR